MANSENSPITIETTIQAPIEKVWECWITPEHIVHWNKASDDWHTPKAENDLRVGGKFVYRMEAKDGSAGFDFGAVYDEIITHEQIAYSLDDGRNVNVVFSGQEGGTKVTQTFDPENTHPIDMQRSGWQAILDNFKNYVESN